MADAARKTVAAGSDIVRLRSERFGNYDVPADRVIHLPDGLVGFPQARQFALLEPSRPESPFRWLLSLDVPDLGFVVCDPMLLWPEYAADLPALEPDVAVVAIVTVPANAQEMTVNLMAPLLIDCGSRAGRQLVLENGRYTTQHRLLA